MDIHPNGPVAKEIARYKAAHPAGDSYATTWMRLRVGRTLVFGVALAWIPMGAMSMHFGNIPVVGIPWFDFVVVLGVLVFVTGAVVVATTRCPACRQLFTTNWEKGSDPLSGRCVNCGVHQWTPEP